MQKIYLDTETTGIGKNEEIIDLGILSKDGEVLMNVLIKPINKNINPFIEKLTGISNKMVENEKTFEELYEDIINVIKDKEIIAYNASFDIKMLVQCAEMIDKGSEMKAITENHTDLLKVYSHYLKLPKIDFKLEEALEIQEINNKQEHRAISDCFMMYLLEESMKQVPPGYDEILKALKRKYIKSPSNILYKKIRMVEDIIKNPMNALTIEMKQKSIIRAYQNGNHDFNDLSKKYAMFIQSVQKVIFDAYIEGLDIDVDEFFAPELEKDILKLYHMCPTYNKYSYIKEKLPQATWENIACTLAKEKRNNNGHSKQIIKSTAKRIVLTPAEIIRRLNNNEKIEDIAKEYGIKTSTAESKIIQAYEQGIDVDLDKYYKPQYHEKVMNLADECPDNQIRRYIKKYLPELEYIHINFILAVDEKNGGPLYIKSPAKKKSNNKKQEEHERF